MHAKVFEDKACTELLLQIILKRADLKVLHVKGQQDIKNLQGRSVTLDILAVDTDNKVYNIEIQRSDKGAAVKWARYNSSLIDSNVTEPGEKYEKSIIGPMDQLLIYNSRERNLYDCFNSDIASSFLFMNITS